MTQEWISVTHDPRATTLFIDGSETCQMLTQVEKKCSIHVSDGTFCQQYT